MAYVYGHQIRESDGKLPAFAWPGGYPIYYLTRDDGVLCPACANGENGSESARMDLDIECRDHWQWIITDHDVNWEDPDLRCDHCNKRIESAYAEPKAIDHYDGDSGAHLLTMTRDAAEDCSVPGQSADDSVAYWRPRVTWVADESTLRRSLRGYGAWDDLETADLDIIKNRVLWLAACDWRERGNEEEDEDDHA